MATVYGDIRAEDEFTHPLGPQTNFNESLTLEGRVKSFISRRNRREERITHIGEGMAEYRCNGRVGLGISAYLDQIQ